MPGPRVVPRLGKRGRLLPFDFDLGALTFIAGMAKRDGSVFAAAPIVQGKWDGTGTPDSLSVSAGSEIFNRFYPTIDANQITVSFWITPEWDGNDGISHYLFRSSVAYCFKHTNSLLYFSFGAQQSAGVDVSGWVAGTTYHIVLSGDTKKTVDGTNYLRIAINNSLSFSGTTQPTPSAAGATNIGGSTSSSGADAIIEGLRIDRRVWYEATSDTGEPYYFDASGYIDEIAAAYAAGAGADPALVEASWDGCMCLPTDSAVGALTTGNGNAWSHPHASALLNNTWLEDGFGPNQQDAVSFNGTSTEIDCGSGATLDDLLLADCTLEGWAKRDGDGDAWPRLVDKSGGGAGWLVAFDNQTYQWYFWAEFATTDCNVYSTINPIEGRWFHWAVVWDSGTNTPELYLDGVRADSGATAGVGAYQSDAALSLGIGYSVASGNRLLGTMGWQRISDNKRYTADFIPPRTMPGADGNTVEQWAMDDGTGATAAATVTSPGNDGTITDGAWTEKFEFTGTPLELTSLEVDGSATLVNCGSAASLDDLADNAFTFETWAVVDNQPAGSRYLVAKDGLTDIGWMIRFSSSYFPLARVACATTNAQADSSVAVIPGRWFHIAITWDDAGDRKIRMFLDGVFVDASSAGVGAITPDNAADLLLGARADGYSINGRISWTRISDNIRYTDNFLPPTRVNPPADDGNTVSLWLFDEGAGTTVADTNANANHGTITMGAGQWWNSFAQEYDSPGSRTYAWGYSIGSDAPSDGFEQHLAVTAGDDHVLRIPVRYEDATAWAQILVYDEIGAAAISTFNGPPLTGLHDGGDDAAAMTDTGNVFPASLIDGEIYNLTDGSNGTITAVGGTNQDTITAALSGGTGDDWDDNDVYMIVPPDNWVWCEPFCIEVPAGCTEASVQLLNAAGAGVLLWQQAEVQENLLDHGDHETLTGGNPDLITGWANADLDAGDTQAEAVVIHSGAQSLEWNPGAVNEGMTITVVGVGDGTFFALGGWQYGDENGFLYIGPTGANGLLQYSAADRYVTFDNDNVWKHGAGVLRSLAANPTIGIHASSGASADRFSDDIYMVELDDVSLTATPASEANSLESGGIRIDGRDQATQVPTVGVLQATQGWIRFRWRPRHSAAQAVAFGETGVTTDIFDGRAPIANYIALYWAAANTVQLIIFDGGVLGIVWDATGLVAVDTEYLVEIRYYPARADLLIDGVVVATGAGGIGFGTDIITLANYGHNNVNADQTDAVFSAP